MYRDKHVSPRPGIVEKVKRERRKPRSPLGSIRRSLCTKERTRDFVLNSNVTGVVNAWDHQRFSNEKKKKEQKKGRRRGQSAVDLAMCDKHSDTEVELDLHTYVFTVNLFHINYSYVYFSSNFPSTLTYSRVVHVTAWFLRKYRVWERKKKTIVRFVVSVNLNRHNDGTQRISWELRGCKTDAIDERVCPAYLLSHLVDSKRLIQIRHIDCSNSRKQAKSMIYNPTLDSRLITIKSYRWRESLCI